MVSGIHYQFPFSLSQENTTGCNRKPLFSNLKKGVISIHMQSPKYLNFLKRPGVNVSPSCHPLHTVRFPRYSKVKGSDYPTHHVRLWCSGIRLQGPILLPRWNGRVWAAQRAAPQNMETQPGRVKALTEEQATSHAFLLVTRCPSRRYRKPTGSTGSAPWGTFRKLNRTSGN